MPHYTEKDDIVCHKEGKPLYTLPDGVQTFFSTRAKVDTPLRLEFADKGYAKADWEPDKVVRWPLAPSTTGEAGGGVGW